MMWICKVKKEWPWPSIGGKNGYFYSAFIALASKLLRLQIHSKRMSKSRIRLDPRKFRITKLRVSLWTKSRNIFPPLQNLSLPSLASSLLAVSSLYLCTRGKSSNLDPGGKCTCLLHHIWRQRSWTPVPYFLKEIVAFLKFIFQLIKQTLKKRITRKRITDPEPCGSGSRTSKHLCNKLITKITTTPTLCLLKQNADKW